MDPEYKEHTHPFFGHLDRSTSGPLKCALTGFALLNNPYFNKGSAFMPEEREQFGLHGMLPPRVQTLEEQVHRAYKQYQGKPDDLSKNTFMNSLRVQNQVLFYRLILDHIKEMMPIIYTPTEGDAISKYSGLFRRPEGCYLNINDVDRVSKDMEKWAVGDEHVDIIVVSDGEQILGIGDQGVGGIWISVAKLMLYSLCAGINPTRTLAVVLDSGTDNEDLLSDELYLGLKEKRKRGEEYDRFVDVFVKSARKHYPKAYIHFEDFGLANARRILEKYSPDMPCFNDDIQGTGCVTLAAVQAALHITGDKISDLRVVMFGAGTAGTGIADQICDAIAVESEKSKEEAAEQIWCFDKIGVVMASKKDKLTPAQERYAKKDEDWKGNDGDGLLGLIKEVKPHVLIGTSTKPGSFTKEIVQEMAKHVERPIIFPLSNPTKLHEAKPEELINWTDGKALVSTGSPFPPVEYNGKKYEIAECNNSVVFPGIGLGAVLAGVKVMTPDLLVAATKAVAARAPILKDPYSGLLPDIEDVRDVSVSIAKAVIKVAKEKGLTQEEDIPEDDEVLGDWIRDQQWEAKYRKFERVNPEEATLHARGKTGTVRNS